MDPNETYGKMMASLALMARMRAEGDTVMYRHAAMGLEEQIRDLDEWLRKGGFPPDEWWNGGVPPEIR